MQLTPAHLSASEFPVLLDSWHYLCRWLELHQSEFERLADPTQAKFLSRVREYGESTFASQCINSLRPKAEKRYSPRIRLLVKVFVVITGSLTFSLGASFFAIHLGKLAPVAVLLAGGVASAAVDSLATRTFTHWHRLRQVHRQSIQLRRQAQINPADSDLKHCLQAAQQQLLEKVEGSYRVRQVPLYALVAGGLSLCELAVTTYVVWGSPLTMNLSNPLKLALAIFPVLLTWAASLLQSTYFDQADEAANLIPQYQHYLRPDMALTPADTHDWLVQRDYEDGKTDAEVQFVLTGDATQNVKNGRMARAEYDIQYHERYLQGLEQQCNRLIMERWQVFQDEQDRLPAEAPVPPVIRKNRSPQQIYEQEHNQTIARRRWVEQEEPKRLARCKQDVLALKANFTAEIRQHQRKLNRAKQDWRRGLQEWQDQQDALDL